MSDRLRHALLILVLAFGMLGGAGMGFASASSGPAPCHDQAMMMQFSGGDFAPAQDCGNGMAHKSCAVHASFVAILAPAPSSAWIDASATDWTALPVSSPPSDRLPPETPPPIALL